MVLYKRYDHEKSEILLVLHHAILDDSMQSVTPIRMNRHACTIYLMSRVCELFFPIMYDCAISFDDDVLILPGAVSTPVDHGPYFFNVGSWLVNLRTMVSLSDWRESFHFISFVPVWLFHFFSGSLQAMYTRSMYSGPTISCVNCVECWSVICPKHVLMPCWIAAQYVVRVLHFSASSFSTVLFLYKCFVSSLFFVCVNVLVIIINSCPHVM